jgi:Asp/Glu/hydantoin racemase
MARILVLNPNSTVDVTKSMDKALDVLRTRGAPEIVCHTLMGTPAGIETQEDVESVVLPTLRHLRENPADAYVIGCFSDPGLAVCREAMKAPVVGIAESAYLTAAGLADKFGVLSIKKGSIARHLRQIRLLGLDGKLAADRALDMGVLELADRQRSIARIIEVGTELRDRDGAGVLILGCASMGTYRTEIETALGLPVVDPTQAAVMRAEGLLRLGYARIA